MSAHPTLPDPALLETIARYYGDRLRTFGATPQGVDWNSARSQLLRFERLAQVLDGSGAFSINDYGCGYGALLDYLEAAGRPFTYCGFDISAGMIDAASARHASSTNSSFTSDREALRPADYTVASGIFNVKLGHPQETWQEYVLQMLDAIDALSTRVFAFNLLSTCSDVEKRRADLFYADPLQMFDVCRRRFSPRVALLHDYPLYEFTMIVRK
jgi:SAM-dependent methyltransferase